MSGVNYCCGTWDEAGEPGGHLFPWKRETQKLDIQIGLVTSVYQLLHSISDLKSANLNQFLLL